ncbi:type III secretion system domain-containing protein [Burkholderia sp. WSM2232]|uniref:type III secretion system domain-containing protein n=1 Tax=Burkholderia sp. WSM2232 TaxID=944436 RepID=UPI0018DAFC6E|nr:type III secretion system domain-containing protein [Burkholderia sp. WSM2232]
MPARAMQSPVEPLLARLYQLSWTPGAWMQEQWWAALDLGHWRPVYASLSSCRAALDSAIAKRRGFPDAVLPASLTAQQRQLLRLEGGLRKHMVGLGVVGLGLQPYLLLGEYRRALAPALDARACNQLLALAAPPGATFVASIEAGRFLDYATSYGQAWLGRQLRGCPVWRALEICLPPPMSIDCDIPSSSAIATLSRLERYL